MGVINLLDIQVANLIAAGEVVDRPASVVKELAENSIDAGATRLDIEIKRGGCSFIRVADNGCGMVRDDVAFSLRRHATSKIRDASDLDGIVTLGFRGEALAAISSVSRIRIMTRHKSEKMGSLLEGDGGTVRSVTDFAGTVGTTVIVEELFGNVPARRKFLKKDSSEALAVEAAVEKIALSRPDIAVKFISDGEIKLQASGDGKLINVIYSALGREVANRTLRVNAMTEGIEITGFIGAPDVVRGNRNMQNFFINGRYIKSRTATAAIEQAFTSFCEVNKFPVCVLNIVLHPAFVDVNVHPTKLEVKFSNERAVFDAIYCAVRNTLNESMPRPRLDPSDLTPRIVETQHVTEEQRAIYNSFLPIYDRVVTPTVPERQQKIGVAPLSPPTPTTREKLSYDNLSYPTVHAAAEPEEEMHPPGNFAPATPKIPQNPASLYSGYRYIGLIFSTYIIVEVGGKILMIDKHAAHERIIFEELRAALHSSNASSQMLIAPLEITLSTDELRALNEYRYEIGAVGYGFTESGKTMTINEIPTGLTAPQAHDAAIEMIARLASGTGNAALTREQIYESALYQASCKAAIKAGTDDNPEHLKYICDKLFTLDGAIPTPRPVGLGTAGIAGGTGAIAYCPHGRPVAFEMTQNAIENSFRRS